MKTNELKFKPQPDQADQDPVSGFLQVPKSAKSLLVLGHGAGAGMRHANLENIAAALHVRQIATFRYQFPFMERGGGRDSQSVSLATVEQAVAKARQLQPKLRLFAGGHSFGGRMTSMAAADSRLPDVLGLVFFAFPLHPSGKPSLDRAEHLDHVPIPMLFLSGTRDKLFTSEMYEPLFKKLSRRPKRQSVQLHLLDTADHSYKTLKRTRVSEESVFEEMGRVASDWIQASV